MIEVRGVQFSNKGAQLMLLAIVQHFSELSGDIKLAAEHCVGTYQQRAMLGLYQKLRTKGLMGNITNIAISSSLRSKYGLVIDSEIDAVIDASGFTYSDQWGEDSCKHMAQFALKWKKQGKKVILLPQAFGPFTSDRIRNDFTTILENTDLIFARDRISLEHIQSFGSKYTHIKLAPDFTNLINGVLPKYFDSSEKYACIVPNFRMIDKCSGDASRGYITFLGNCIKIIKDRNLKPLILIHETKDIGLGPELQKEVGEQLTIIQEPDPIHLKGILGSCDVVIGSRFHALVSALSQGVPCLATGWSHKYQILFEDYNCSEFIASPQDSNDALIQKLDNLLNENTCSLVVKKIMQASTDQKEKSKAMWAEVDSLLGY